MNQEQLNEALSRACREGDLEKAGEYLEKGANPNATDELGRTPLHWAAWNGHTGIVKILIEEGANPNATDNDGWTPLHYAASDGQIEAAKLLIEAGSNPKAIDIEGKTPLHIAVEEEYPEIVELLKEAMKEESEQLIRNKLLSLDNLYSKNLEKRYFPIHPFKSFLEIYDFLKSGQLIDHPIIYLDKIRSTQDSTAINI